MLLVLIAHTRILSTVKIWGDGRVLEGYLLAQSFHTKRVPKQLCHFPSDSFETLCIYTLYY